MSCFSSPLKYSSGVIGYVYMEVRWCDESACGAMLACTIIKRRFCVRAWGWCHRSPRSQAVSSTASRAPRATTGVGAGFAAATAVPVPPPDITKNNAGPAAAYVSLDLQLVHYRHRDKKRQLIRCYHHYHYYYYNYYYCCY